MPQSGRVLRNLALQRYDKLEIKTKGWKLKMNRHDPFFQEISFGKWEEEMLDNLCSLLSVNSSCSIILWKAGLGEIHSFSP